EMQQTISVYLIAYAGMSLLHGPLSDAYGRRIVILGGVTGFTLASVGCALAPSIEWLLACRALQGVCIGAGLIVGRALTRDLFDGTQALKVQSLITLFFSVAPVVAPIIGGFVYMLSGWRAVFWFLALYGSALLLLCLRVLPETHPIAQRTRFVPRVLFATYREIAVDRRYALLAVSTGFNFGAFFLYISSAPAFVERILGLGTFDYAWFFGPCILGMMTGATLANRMAGRATARGTVRLGYAISAVAMLANLAYWTLVESPTVPWAVLAIAANSIGIALNFPTLSLKMLDRYPRNRGAASSVQAFVWGVMTSLIAGFLSPALSWSGLALALGAAALSASGYACWWLYARITPVEAAAPVAAPLIEEPVEPV
ncbi:MAG TPA: multidrug effflux MFS transporter, partial [Candidatus Saccharimonadia bacterium]|nr:multidrug effflux MFS transporter [Candidatus Saccharimonadia bacterium]